MSDLAADLSEESAGYRTLIAPLIPYMASDDARWVEVVLQQLDEQQLCIAIMGEIKVGKSTLINALLQRTVLISDVVECTSAPTYVRNVATLPDAEPDSVRVTWTDHSVDWVPLAHIERLTTLTAGDPHQRIERVELFLGGEMPPASLTIVDTPGLNGRAELEDRTLRQMALAHVAVVVLAMDRGVGTALDVKAIAQAHRVAGRLLIVINKGDRAPDEESRRRVRQELVDKLADNGVRIDPALIFIVSAKHQLEGGYQDRDEELQHGFFSFQNAIIDRIGEDWRVETIRRQPRTLIADVASRVRARLHEERAALEGRATADLDAERAALEAEIAKLDATLEPLLERARADARYESNALTTYIRRGQTEVIARLRALIDGLSDEALTQERRAATEVGAWMRGELDDRFQRRIRALYEAVSTRLFTDLEAQAGKGLKLKLPGSKRLAFDISELERDLNARFAADRHAAEDEIVAARQKRDHLKRELEQLRVRRTSLQQDLAAFQSLQADLARERKRREDLGARPKPKITYTSESKTRPRARSGWFAGLLDSLMGTKWEAYTEQVPHSDDSRGEAWDRSFKPLDQAVKSLEARVARDAAVEAQEQQAAEDATRLEVAVVHAEASLERAQRARAEAEAEFRRTGLLERRGALVVQATGELERALNELCEELQPNFERLLGEVERTFKRQFEEQSRAYREALSRAVGERLATYEAQDRRLAECREGLRHAETILAAVR